jgi:hypothetical protein
VTGPAVSFEIERLTLHGYGPADRARFLDALHAGLSELGASADWAAAAPVRLGRLRIGELRPGATPEDAARQLTGGLRAALDRGSVRR